MFGYNYSIKRNDRLLLLGANKKEKFDSRKTPLSDTAEDVTPVTAGKD
jgi:hypothetical protein